MMSQTSVVDDKDGNTTTVSETGGTISQACENTDGATPDTVEVVFSVGSVNTADSAALGSNIDDGNAFATAVNSTQQKTPVMSHDATEIFSSLGNPPLDSTLDANGVSQAGAEATVIITENGVASADDCGSAALHQPPHGSGLSAEEERLWSIVTTNSLDFGAWTALIEETERASEGNILKIRKVYDTFLAEFPLCYGYWKKYADHEARFSSVDKVGEVYERAVQGVTYSVDIWVHYCVFAVGAYGNPDPIRSHLQQQLLKCKV